MYKPISWSLTAVSFLWRSWTLAIVGLLLSEGLACQRRIHNEQQRASAQHLDKISVLNSDFVDSHGRVRLFHGINAVLKYSPWYPQWLLDDTKLQYLRDWGFNVVRLGSMWSGVQPAHDVINRTYIDQLEEIVHKLNDYGIYVILDMHQDVISSRYGTYDGMPRWLVDRLPASPHAFPWPLPRVTQWADGYVTQAAGVTFQQLYNNTGNARHHLAEFWRTLASRFNSFTNVLGYDIINEPWCGDVYSNPELLLPGNAGRLNLQPLYNVMNDVIRRQDNDTIVFYEPVTWGVVFRGSVSGTGFSAVPGGSEYRNRSALSYHYYCWILTADSTKPYSPWKRTLCDRILGPKVFNTVADDIKVTGGASFLTEFGLCKPDGDEKSTETIECEYVLNMADRHAQSWTYWDSPFFFGNGSVDVTTVRPFARPYPRAVYGNIKMMTFSVRTGVFTLVYSPRHGNSSHTEVFVPLLHYPRGFVATKSTCLSTWFDESTRILSVAFTGACNNSVAKITIQPKSQHGK